VGAQTYRQKYEHPAQPFAGARIAEVPRDRRIAVHCAGGYRSSIAASILHHYGITNLIEMAGGLAAWDAAKLRVVSEA